MTDAENTMSVMVLIGEATIAVKLVMLILSHPSFMQKHSLRLEDVRNLVLLAQYGGQSTVLEHLKTFATDCKLVIRW